MVFFAWCFLWSLLPVALVIFPCARKDKQKRATAAVAPVKNQNPKVNNSREKSEKHPPATPKREVQKNKDIQMKEEIVAIVKQENKPSIQPQKCGSNKLKNQGKQQTELVANKSDIQPMKALNHSKRDMKKAKKSSEAQQVESDSKPISSESEEEISSKRVQADDEVRKKNRRKSILRGIKKGFYVTKKKAREMKKTLEEYNDPEEEPSESARIASTKRQKKRLDEAALIEESKKKRQQQSNGSSDAPPRESSSSKRKRQGNNEKDKDAVKKEPGNEDQNSSNPHHSQQKKRESKSQKKNGELPKYRSPSLLNGVACKELKSSSSSEKKRISRVDTTFISGSADVSPASLTSPGPLVKSAVDQRKKLNKGDDVMPRKRKGFKKRMDEIELYKYGNPKELKRQGFLAPQDALKRGDI